MRLALGPVPVVGEDDTYPKDRRGRPVQPVKFTIRAEKCPNRRGVEEVLRHFQGEVLAFRRRAAAGRRGPAPGRVPGGRLSAARRTAGSRRRRRRHWSRCRCWSCRTCSRRRPATLAKYVLPAASLRREGRHVRQPCGPGPGDPLGDPAAAAAAAPTARSSSICWSGAAWCTRRRCGRNWPRSAVLCAAWRSGDLGEHGVCLESAK